MMDVSELYKQSRELKENAYALDVAFDKKINEYLSKNPNEDKNLDFFDIEIARCEHEINILTLETKIETLRIKIYNARRFRRMQNKQLTIEEYERDEEINERKLASLEQQKQIKSLELMIEKRDLMMERIRYELETDSLMSDEDAKSLEYQLSLLEQDNKEDAESLKVLVNEQNKITRTL